MAGLAETLRRHVDERGSLSAGVATAVAAETGWSGRLMDLLQILTQDDERMGYLAGGHRPDEVATWLGIWVDSALSLDQIRWIIDAGGWEPEPFVALARAGLLQAVLSASDGTVRRIQGELAGAWLSDELALADDTTVVETARRIIAGELGGREGRETRS